jgi:predicted metal-dependent phosphoesterase TrpH
MKQVADLHMHTNHSDGTLNPVELARLAKSQGVDAVALTDHDTVSGIQELV